MLRILLDELAFYWVTDFSFLKKSRHKNDWCLRELRIFIGTIQWSSWEACWIWWLTIKVRRTLSQLPQTTSFFFWGGRGGVTWLSLLPKLRLSSPLTPLLTDFINQNVSISGLLYHIRLWQWRWKTWLWKKYFDILLGNGIASIACSSNSKYSENGYDPEKRSHLFCSRGREGEELREKKWRLWEGRVGLERRY